VLRAPWKKIVCTPAISIKTRLTRAMVKRIQAGGSTLGGYRARFYQEGGGAGFMWDELAAAAWIDPSPITWTEMDKPKFVAGLVEIQMDLDAPRFYEMFVNPMTAGTPAAHQ
jgi:purine nucleosidase